MKEAHKAQLSRERQRFKEHVLRNGRVELALRPERGCDWTRLRISVKGQWRDLLVPVPEPTTQADRPSGCGSFVMAPWSNRIAGAAFVFAGERHELRPSFRDGTAIHGDVSSRPWRVVAASGERFEAHLDSRDVPDFNYPFALVFRHAIELARDRLRIELELENVDGRRAPVGLGFHPFLRRRISDADDDLILVVPAARVYPAENCIPTGAAVPVADRTDLRRLAFLGAPDLDHCYTGFEAQEFRAIYPGSGVEVRFHVDSAFTHAVVYAPNASPGTPRDFVAVEPVSNANDGFNLHERGWPGTGVKVLAPGERWGGGWELSVGDI
jgi:aldose 1-epimerase